MHRALSLFAAVLVMGVLWGCAAKGPQAGDAAVMTASAQSAMTPAEALAELKAGNQRFAAGRGTDFHYLAQAERTAAQGQYPKAVVLSCLDSRVPVEVVFDQGIGDVFVGRVAGNVEDVAMLGSFEFATELAGTPLIVVLGHSQCGAVKGAIAGAELGHLTTLLAEIQPAVDAADAAGQGSASNTALVDAVVEANVRQTVADLTARSAVLRQRVEAGRLMIVGGVYDLASGEVTWLR